MAERIAVIAQARMGSIRLPGKVLKTVGGRTVVAHVLSRAQAIEGVHAVCCATTTDHADDEIAEQAARIGCLIYRGSPDDVLDRYTKAAVMLDASIILRITCDCPLLDPLVCAELIHLRQSTQADYAANNFTASWPHGLDCEIFTIAALRQADAAGHTPHEREHVTPWMRRSPDLVKANLEGPGGDAAAMRWTLDYPEDLTFLQALAVKCDLTSTMRWEDIAAVIAANPELLSINSIRCGRERPGSNASSVLPSV